MSKSRDYEVMTSVPPKEEYQMVLFKWGLLLSKFGVSSFSMTGDIDFQTSWRYIDFQTSHFAGFEQSKILFILLTLGKEKLTLLVYFYQLWPGHSNFLDFGQDVWPRKKNPNPLRLTKNSRTTHRVWYKSFPMIQSVGIRNWVPQL